MGAVRVMVTERQVGQTSEPTARDVSEALIAVCGTGYGMHSPTWISRFTDVTRQAASYRDRRVLLGRRRRTRALPDGRAGPQHQCAGRGEPGIEASPGGQRGIAGKPAGHLPRRAAPGRRPGAAQHDGANRAQPPRHTHRAVARHHVRTAEHGRAAQADRRDDVQSGHSYDLGDGHPLLGRRTPDLDPVTAKGPQRVFTLLHAARPVLLNLGEPGEFDITPWADGSSRSTLNMLASGSLKYLARSLLLPRCWSGPTNMWPGRET